MELPSIGIVIFRRRHGGRHLKLTGICLHISSGISLSILVLPIHATLPGRTTMREWRGSGSHYQSHSRRCIRIGCERLPQSANQRVALRRAKLVSPWHGDF